MLLLYQESGVIALHIVIDLNYFTLVCNVISVLVEMVNSTMVKVDNFFKLFVSLQKCKPLGERTRKRNFFDYQKENCAPGTQMRIAYLDKRFCRDIEKSICAGKIYPNFFYSDSICLQ